MYDICHTTSTKIVYVVCIVAHNYTIVHIMVSVRNGKEINVTHKVAKVPYYSGPLPHSYWWSNLFAKRISEQDQII